MDVLKRLFEEQFGSPATSVEALQGQLGGSGRRIVRLRNDKGSAIGILYGVREENRAFLEFSRHFRKHGLPVPRIYGEALDEGAYLEEDLGDTTLFEFLAANRDGNNIAQEVISAYKKTIEYLPRFQVEVGPGLNYKVCHPRERFDRQSITWDLNYFKYYFLKLAGIPFHEQALEDDFAKLTDFLLTAESEYFLYRDFQSRNVMLQDGQPYFLDYQGGRKGALQYDIASVLFDAKADLPPEVREQLLDHYLGALAKYARVDRAEFLRYYYPFVYVRIMQALGAYGFRGFYERKPHFLQSVPYALKNVRWLLHNVEFPIELPALMEAFRTMVGSEELQHIASHTQNLTVRIVSFSFHRGWPSDESGNGGGFVFDARSIPNPGREERYKDLTGKDAAVAEFLQRQPALHQFMAAVTTLVDSSVQEYQRRGFQNLMISFGCTGGQHRSVYLAEQLAQRLSGRSGVDVVLQHRELERMGR